MARSTSPSALPSSWWWLLVLATALLSGVGSAAFLRVCSAHASLPKGAVSAATSPFPHQRTREQYRAMTDARPWREKRAPSVGPQVVQLSSYWQEDSCDTLIADQYEPSGTCFTGFRNALLTCNRVCMSGCVCVCVCVCVCMYVCVLCVLWVEF